MSRAEKSAAKEETFTSQRQLGVEAPSNLRYTSEWIQLPRRGKRSPTSIPRLSIHLSGLSSPNSGNHTTGKVRNPIPQPWSRACRNTQERDRKPAGRCGCAGACSVARGGTGLGAGAGDVTTGRHVSAAEGGKGAWCPERRAGGGGYRKGDGWGSASCSPACNPVYTDALGTRFTARVPSLDIPIPATQRIDMGYQGNRREEAKHEETCGDSGSS